MLEAEVTVRERRLRLGQLLQLAGDFHPLQRRAAGELALPAQPRRQRERAIGSVLTRLVEAAHADGEDGLERGDAGFPDLDEPLSQADALGVASTGRHLVTSRLERRNRRPRAIA